MERSEVSYSVAKYNNQGDLEYSKRIEKSILAAKAENSICTVLIGFYFRHCMASLDSDGQFGKEGHSVLSSGIQNHILGK